MAASHAALLGVDGVPSPIALKAELDNMGRFWNTHGPREMSEIVNFTHRRITLVGAMLARIDRMAREHTEGLDYCIEEALLDVGHRLFELATVKEEWRDAIPQHDSRSAGSPPMLTGTHVSELAFRFASIVEAARAALMASLMSCKERFPEQASTIVADELESLSDELRAAGPRALDIPIPDGPDPRHPAAEDIRQVVMITPGIHSPQHINHHITGLKSWVENSAELIKNPVMRVGYTLLMQDAIRHSESSRSTAKAWAAALASSSSMPPRVAEEEEREQGKEHDDGETPSPADQDEVMHDVVCGMRTLVQSQTTRFGTACLRTYITPLRPSADGCPEIEVSTSCEVRPSPWLLGCALKYGLQAEVHAAQVGLIASRGVSIDHFLLQRLDAPIFDSAQLDNVWAIKTLLQRGHASLADRDSEGWTLLHFACYTRALRVARFLVNAGVSKTAAATVPTTWLGYTVTSPAGIFLTRPDCMGELTENEVWAWTRLFFDSLDFSESGDGWYFLFKLLRYSEFNVPPYLDWLSQRHGELLEPAKEGPAVYVQSLGSFETWYNIQLTGAEVTAYCLPPGNPQGFLMALEKLVFFTDGPDLAVGWIEHLLDTTDLDLHDVHNRDTITSLAMQNPRSWVFWARTLHGLAQSLTASGKADATPEEWLHEFVVQEAAAQYEAWMPVSAEMHGALSDSATHDGSAVENDGDENGGDGEDNSDDDETDVEEEGEAEHAAYSSNAKPHGEHAVDGSPAEGGPVEGSLANDDAQVPQETAADHAKVGETASIAESDATYNGHAKADDSADEHVDEDLGASETAEVDSQADTETGEGDESGEETEGDDSMYGAASPAIMLMNRGVWDPLSTEKAERALGWFIAEHDAIAAIFVDPDTSEVSCDRCDKSTHFENLFNPSWEVLRHYVLKCGLDPDSVPTGHFPAWWFDPENVVEPEWETDSEGDEEGEADDGGEGWETESEEGEEGEGEGEEAHEEVVADAEGVAAVTETAAVGGEESVAEAGHAPAHEHHGHGHEHGHHHGHHHRHHHHHAHYDNALAHRPKPAEEGDNMGFEMPAPAHDSHHHHHNHHGHGHGHHHEHPEHGHPEHTVAAFEDAPDVEAAAAEADDDDASSCASSDASSESSWDETPNFGVRLAHVSPGCPVAHPQIRGWGTPAHEYASGPLSHSERRARMINMFLRHFDWFQAEAADETHFCLSCMWAMEWDIMREEGRWARSFMPPPPPPVDNNTTYLVTADVILEIQARHVTVPRQALDHLAEHGNVYVPVDLIVQLGLQEHPGLYRAPGSDRPTVWHRGESLDSSAEEEEEGDEEEEEEDGQDLAGEHEGGDEEAAAQTAAEPESEKGVAAA